MNALVRATAASLTPTGKQAWELVRCSSACRNLVAPTALFFPQAGMSGCASSAFGQHHAKAFSSWRTAGVRHRTYTDSGCFTLRRVLGLAAAAAASLGCATAAELGPWVVPTDAGHGNNRWMSGVIAQARAEAPSKGGAPAASPKSHGNSYTKEEVARHKTKEQRIWVTYKVGGAHAPAVVLGQADVLAPCMRDGRKQERSLFLLATRLFQT
jgi:hypothetical protein